MKKNLELISAKDFANYEEMYKVVDFLNKTLYDTKIVLGLSQKDGKQIISIYKET